MIAIAIATVMAVIALICATAALTLAMFVTIVDFLNQLETCVQMHLMVVETVAQKLGTF